MDTMTNELWRVQLSTGEIRTMTLDELDRAFDEGLIDPRVPVLPPGASAWTTLGEAAGLNETPTEQAPSLTPVAISSATPTPAPTEVSSGATSDLPDTFDERGPPRRRRLLVGGVAGTVALAAMALVALRGSSPTPTVDVNTASAVQAPPAVDPLPAPEPKEAKQGLSDWQKRMLLDADKAREEKARAKNQERVNKAGPHKKSPKSSSGLLNGGDKFDPLNGAL